VQAQGAASNRGAGSQRMPSGATSQRYIFWGKKRCILAGKEGQLTLNYCSGKNEIKLRKNFRKGWVNSYDSDANAIFARKSLTANSS